MASALSKVRRFVSWFIPYGVVLLRKKLGSTNKLALPPYELLASNKALQGKHEGRRCVILANGPSAKNLELIHLKGEIVLSVSNGYLHPNFAEFAPKYHCVPQITYGRMSVDDVVRWFSEMHEQLGDAELFLNETEADLVRDHNLFPGRKLHFLAMRENFDDMTADDRIDLATIVPRVQSVPVMAIMIAMYMGFSEIVLLGADHDHFKDGKYVYAFDLGVQKDKDFSVAQDGQVTTAWYDDFHSLARLWRQYRVLGDMAKTQDVKIVNATPGGELDEFPRVPYGSLFPRSSQ
ncbi:hypothetical protein DXT88_01785 [Herbaspirillum lusitanum]|uniref:hypothetical protein n=1 Tax=Herbaspirillum lusitanum TaxID=213312 RepID=UPI002237BED4|nr:hypothetical protein [Herbaspirillum lusitanum]MCW5296900.1 hypothetical protein [Herbaspirillum lusitanum]